MSWANLCLAIRLLLYWISVSIDNVSEVMVPVLLHCISLIDLFLGLSILTPPG